MSFLRFECALNKQTKSEQNGKSRYAVYIVFLYRKMKPAFVLSPTAQIRGEVKMYVHYKFTAVFTQRINFIYEYYVKMLHVWTFFYFYFSSTKYSSN